MSIGLFVYVNLEPLHLIVTELKLNLSAKVQFSWFLITMNLYDSYDLFLNPWLQTNLFRNGQRHDHLYGSLPKR